MHRAVGHYKVRAVKPREHSRAACRDCFPDMSDSPTLNENYTWIIKWRSRGSFIAEVIPVRCGKYNSRRVSATSLRESLSRFPIKRTRLSSRRSFSATRSSSLVLPEVFLIVEESLRKRHEITLVSCERYRCAGRKQSGLTRSSHRVAAN
jgi:hypothetical protein